MIRALWIVLALGACKQANEPAASGAVLAKSRELSAAMCACTTTVCAAPLLQQWSELTKLLHGATFTEDQVEGLTTEDTRFERCMTALTH